jgi:hypothetical protein
MKRLVTGVLAAMALVSVPHTLTAQSKTLTGEIKVEQATVEAIEASTRSVTLKRTDGTYLSTVAGPEVKRFDEIKIGDKVTARYYDTLVVRVKQPGEPDVASQVTGTTGSAQAVPGGTKAKQTTITATIAAIDQNTPSITFTGPNGWKYTSRVEDKAALAKVKVGDKVDIVWTEAMLVSIER